MVLWPGVYYETLKTKKIPVFENQQNRLHRFNRFNGVMSLSCLYDACGLLARLDQISADFILFGRIVRVSRTR